MPPNPVTLPRKHVQQAQEDSEHRAASGLTKPLLATSLVVVVVATLPWARRWALSGCAIESLLIIYGNSCDYGRILPFVPLWTLLATLNLVYAVASTSWLLYALFGMACYPCILLTSLSQFALVADFARRTLRRMLRQLHFTRDKIALFNLPALEIDVDVDGLLVVRGITISLSTLTIVAHGIELGIKLTDDIELAVYADVVTIRLFRRIEIGDVYGNIKGGKTEMTFAELEDPQDDDEDEDAVLLGGTPLLRVATAKSEGFKDRPKLRESLPGGSYVQDSTPRAVLNSVRTLSPTDEKAEQEYLTILTEIRTHSAIYQSRATVRKHAKAQHGEFLRDDQNLRAAICAELHPLPSVPHPPPNSIRVTTLQNLTPPYVRRFLHRLPFLLRLLLGPLSYFHPVEISSINAAGSGQWLSALLHQHVFKTYSAESSEIRRLERRIIAWLANANFCVQLAEIDGMGQVPLSTALDVVAFLKFRDIMAYRTVPDEGTIAQVVRLGGADATFMIPSFLLPHHEHILPPRPTAAQEHQLCVEVQDADGKPKTVHAEQELKKAQKDETTVTISVHGSLPAVLDQSLLNFVAALVKATKIIEMEKEVDEVVAEQHHRHASSGANGAGPDAGPASPTSPSADSDTASIASTVSAASSSATTPTGPSSSRDGFRKFTRNIRQTLKEGGAATHHLREYARDLQQNTVGGMKRALVGGVINDRWIAKLVGKVAAKLEKAQGDVGYSGGIPVALAPYRAAGELPGKLLP